MRPVDCQQCAQVADRNAVLVHVLKKVVTKLHRTHHGESEHSWTCSHPDCKAAWDAIDHG